MSRFRFIASIAAESAPVLVFVAVSESRGFMSALVVLMGVVLLSLIASWLLERRVPLFALVASGIILIFGALSLLTANPFFIIVKDTLYALFCALALLIARFLGRHPFRILFGDFFLIRDAGWAELERRWMIFFFLLTLGNEAARAILTPELWVRYKVATLAATWIFGFAQLTLLRRERLPEANAWGLRIQSVQNSGQEHILHHSSSAPKQ